MILAHFSFQFFFLTHYARVVLQYMSKYWRYRILTNQPCEDEALNDNAKAKLVLDGELVRDKVNAKLVEICVARQRCLP